MEVIEAIRSRRSIRRFKPDPVPRKVLEEILETCRWAPSRFNMQPWYLTIVGGKVMEEVKARLEEKESTRAGFHPSQKLAMGGTVIDKEIRFTEKERAEAAINPDIPFTDFLEPYLQRALHVRDSMDKAQFPPGTENLDEKRAEYWIRGGRFHEASNAIILCTDKYLCPGALFDTGLIAQTICLTAHAHGLGTCVIGRTVLWPDMLREMLGISDDKLLVMGIAIGYPIIEAPLNNFPRERAPLDVFTQWRGFK